MPSNLVLDLPHEILAIIINELAVDNDKPEDKTLLAALGSCRLASHVLCSLATPLFFASISLTDKYNFRRGSSLFVIQASELNNIVATRNIIAASINSLSVSLDYDNVFLRNFSSLSGDIMSDLLPRLPHIQKFSLKSRNKSSGISFDSFSANFAAAIEALCKSPNLTTLDLDHIRHFPFTTIRTSPNLRCLRLWGFDPGLVFDNVNSRDEISSSHLLQLESLEVDAEVIPRGIPTDVSIANCFSRLKSVQIKDIFQNSTCFGRGWDVMLLASQTLEKIELTVDGWASGMHINKSQRMLASVPFRFPALRHFIVTAGSYCSYGKHNPLTLCFLTSLLSIPSSPSGIEVLEIRITWFDVEQGKELFSSDPGWSTLDELFTSQRYVSLRKVVLCSELYMARDLQPPHMEFERNLTLPHVTDLFPLFKASNTQRTVETHLKVLHRFSDPYGRS